MGRTRNKSNGAVVSLIFRRLRVGGRALLRSSADYLWRRAGSKRLGGQRRRGGQLLVCNERERLQCDDTVQFQIGERSRRRSSHPGHRDVYEGPTTPASGAGGLDGGANCVFREDTDYKLEGGAYGTLGLVLGDVDTTEDATFAIRVNRQTYRLKAREVANLDNAFVPCLVSGARSTSPPALTDSLRLTDGIRLPTGLFLGDITVSDVALLQGDLQVFGNVRIENSGLLLGHDKMADVLAGQATASVPKLTTVRRHTYTPIDASAYLASGTISISDQPTALYAPAANWYAYDNLGQKRLFHFTEANENVPGGEFPDFPVRVTKTSGTWRFRSQRTFETLLRRRLRASWARSTWTCSTT